MIDEYGRELPQWVADIRVGNFQGAEQELSNKALERARAEYTANVLQQEAIKIRDESPFGKYVHNDAVARVNSDIAAGIMQYPKCE